MHFILSFVISGNGGWRFAAGHEDFLMPRSPVFLPVTEEFLSRRDALQMYDLGRLPGEAGDNIRVVRIGEYDACPCSGPHVRSTREIGIFHISSKHNDYPTDRNVLFRQGFFTCQANPRIICISRIIDNLIS